MAHDLADVQSVIANGLVVPHLALTLFDAIEPLLFRYPVIDGASFRKRVEEICSRPSPTTVLDGQAEVPPRSC